MAIDSCLRDPTPSHPKPLCTCHKLTYTYPPQPLPILPFWPMYIRPAIYAEIQLITLLANEFDALTASFF